MLINSIDPGFRNLARVSIHWSARVRRVLCADTIKTTLDMSDADSWAKLNGAIFDWAHKSVGVADYFAAEELTGTRHGHDARGTTSASTDTLIQLQGAIRLACTINMMSLTLVRSQSVNSALGIKLPPSRVVGRDARRKLQKAATRSVVVRLLQGAENLDEHQCDACAIAIAAALGKGVTT